VGSFASIPRCPSYVRLLLQDRLQKRTLNARSQAPDFAEWTLRNIRPSEAASLRLDARDLYNLVPLRRLGGDVGFERGGAQYHRNRADIGEPRPDVRLR